jgi:transcriptional regulator of met regulon
MSGAAWIAAGELVAIVVVVLTFARLLQQQQRAHARREDLLVNQLLHAAGRDWQPAPAEQLRREQRDDLERQPRYMATPEQHS